MALSIHGECSGKECYDQPDHSWLQQNPEHFPASAAFWCHLITLPVQPEWWRPLRRFLRTCVLHPTKASLCFSSRSDSELYKDAIASLKSTSRERSCGSRWLGFIAALPPERGEDAPMLQTSPKRTYDPAYFGVCPLRLK
jgi:hypothetical protein